MQRRRRQPRIFTEEALADMHRRCVETDETFRSIAADYDIGPKTLRRLREKLMWPERSPVVQGLRADPKLEVETEGEAEVEAEAEAEAEADDADRREEPDGPPLSIVDRLECAVEKELAAAELKRRRIGPKPATAAEAERTIRMLKRLTETLGKVRQLRMTNTVENNDVAACDIPRDIDEFRRGLARKIEILIRARRGDGASRSDDSGGADPAR
jgi:hypothetical protein